MSRTIVKLFVVFCAALISADSFAQIFVPIYIPATKKVKERLPLRSTDNSKVEWDGSYTGSMVSWDERKLTWDDFKANKLNAPDSVIYNMNFSIRPIDKKEKRGNTTYIYRVCESLFNTANSWVVDSCKNFTMLKMCQTNFDIWELYGRKALIEYNSIPDVSINEIYDFYDRCFYRRVEELKKATNNGRNREEIDKFATEIEEELAATKFNPAGLVSSLGEHHGHTLDMGLSSRISLSKFASPSVGLDIAFGYIKKNMMYGLGMDLQVLGDIKQDVYASKGEILDGDRLLDGGMYFNAGYHTRHNKGVELTPYIGVGFRFCEGGELYPQYRDPKRDRNPVTCGGFSLGIGCMTDIIISRKVDIKVSDTDILKNAQSLRIKPYFNVTRYDSGIGWVPAFNISISWGTTSYVLK